MEHTPFMSGTGRRFLGVRTFKEDLKMNIIPSNYCYIVMEQHFMSGTGCRIRTYINGIQDLGCVLSDNLCPDAR